MPQYRDPVHGFIHVSEAEQKIIDSKPFQRLRNIRQLATTYLVYHGAEHTRFGHSIGVMHLVTRAFDAVTSKNKNIFSQDSRENELKIIWYRQILRLIALTHDLGHPPFSHATEDLFVANLKHEDYTKQIIEQSEINEYILDIGLSLHKAISEKAGLSDKETIERYCIRPISPQLIWMVYEGKDVINGEYLIPDFPFLREFMDGELDCDKMDYLLRDSLYCGVTYGKYDLERFISSLTVYRNLENKILRLAITSGGVQAFEEFVLARYFMFIQVYFHKTRRYFDDLLRQGMKEILPEGKFPSSTADYLDWDDVKVLQLMKTSQNATAKEYLARRTMSCIYETPAHSTRDKILLAQNCFQFIKKEFPDAQFHSDDADKKAHKLLPSVYSSGDDETGIFVIDKHTSEPSNIMDHSRILSGIIENIYIYRIYAKGNEIEQYKQWIIQQTSDNTIGGEHG